MTEPSPGQQLASRFELLRLLGRGGMGQVWLAKDAELGDQVALKILQQQLLADPAMIELMRHECRQARRLIHPSIVRVYDFHQTDGLAFISMEYVDGGELGRLRDAPPAEILSPLVTLTGALAYAHDQGVIHRDLKPSNVLLDHRGQPKLLDFGIAAALDTGSGLSLSGGGTRVSASPEQAAGLPPSPADDAFSLGILLYELVTGFPPEPAEGRALPLMRSRRNFDVPERLQELVGRLLAWEARARWSDMRAVGDEMESILETCRGRTVPPSVRIVDPAIPAMQKGPVIQGSIHGAPAAAAPGGSGGGSVPGKRSGVMAFVWAAFAVLLLALAAVVFLLPRHMESRVPHSEAGSDSAPGESEMSEAGAEVPPALTVTDVEQLTESKRAADKALNAYEARRRALLLRAAEEWGSAALADAGSLAEAAHRAYRIAAYAEAREGWEEASSTLAGLEQRGDEMVAAARSRARDALARGNREIVEREFRLVLKLNPDDAEALEGLERAPQIERVIQLMREGERLELSGRLEDAATVYREALETDPALEDARNAVTRVDAALVQRAYADAMSRGYGALETGAYDDAVSAFRQAARIRPGASEPAAGLEQARTARSLNQIQTLARTARELEQQERWQPAVAAYEQILNIDPSVIVASQGLQRCRARAEIDTGLQTLLDDPERLFQPEGEAAATAVLEAAANISEPGPRLSGQMLRLGDLLAIATRPVQVTLESDNLTAVTVYRVGRLGSFERKTLDLRPGDYTVVGTRSGFRDVRRVLRLRPGERPASLSIRCEEPI
ncbi:MAG: protein kinase [Gammaproteobacteria bacterium]